MKQRHASRVLRTAACVLLVHVVISSYCAHATLAATADRAPSTDESFAQDFAAYRWPEISKTARGVYNAAASVAGFALAGPQGAVAGPTIADVFVDKYDKFLHEDARNAADAAVHADVRAAMERHRSGAAPAHGTVQALLRAKNIPDRVKLNALGDVIPGFARALEDKQREILSQLSTQHALHDGLVDIVAAETAITAARFEEMASVSRARDASELLRAAGTYMNDPAVAAAAKTLNADAPSAASVGELRGALADAVDKRVRFSAATADLRATASGAASVLHLFGRHDDAAKVAAVGQAGSDVAMSLLQLTGSALIAPVSPLTSISTLLSATASLSQVFGRKKGGADPSQAMMKMLASISQQIADVRDLIKSSAFLAELQLQTAERRVLEAVDGLRSDSVHNTQQLALLHGALQRIEADQWASALRVERGLDELKGQLHALHTAPLYEKLLSVDVAVTQARLTQFQSTDFDREQREKVRSAQIGLRQATARRCRADHCVREECSPCAFLLVEIFTGQMKNAPHQVNITDNMRPTLMGWVDTLHIALLQATLMVKHHGDPERRERHLHATLDRVLELNATTTELVRHKTLATESRSLIAPAIHAYISCHGALATAIEREWHREDAAQRTARVIAQESHFAVQAKEELDEHLRQAKTLSITHGPEWFKKYKRVRRERAFVLAGGERHSLIFDVVETAHMAAYDKDRRDAFEAGFYRAEKQSIGLRSRILAYAQYGSANDRGATYFAPLMGNLDPHGSHFASLPAPRSSELLRGTGLDAVDDLLRLLVFDLQGGVRLMYEANETSITIHARASVFSDTAFAASRGVEEFTVASVVLELDAAPKYLLKDERLWHAWMGGCVPPTDGYTLTGPSCCAQHTAYETRVPHQIEIMPGHESRFPLSADAGVVVNKSAVTALEGAMAVVAHEQEMAVRKRVAATIRSGGAIEKDAAGDFGPLDGALRRFEAAAKNVSIVSTVARHDTLGMPNHPVTKALAQLPLSRDELATALLGQPSPFRLTQADNEAALGRQQRQTAVAAVAGRNPYTALLVSSELTAIELGSVMQRLDLVPTSPDNAVLSAGIAVLSQIVESYAATALPEGESGDTTKTNALLSAMMQLVLQKLTPDAQEVLRADTKFQAIAEYVQSDESADASLLREMLGIANGQRLLGDGRDAGNHGDDQQRSAPRDPDSAVPNL
uniref:Uncharacterized protein n=1 Tax=Neobodo designis TaxID=312471 RepID=A0A7S1MFZ6_NEODS|mmetsp:Transcript_39996/g.123590  ORF Transcript_39996/g.123590 Transcript_39996/m.123590 type:complete len:1191 (+) Transcript_39996:139-3711(+)|eukprot:CAMPEP_0174848284 /NCGR_PEP_ID=MMETSP1114-20130205/13429_1 /TAXON_ID=312471 /ORGANISM="Neobodo designis, Strain CCAP 1951/1" /LENGTH=1190 /DNA_ID=CAMNT_0016082583 /DNA_START=139 /DNA_END=3711 /DNA_ORIENTATION=+